MRPAAKEILEILVLLGLLDLMAPRDLQDLKGTQVQQALLEPRAHKGPLGQLVPQVLLEQQALLPVRS